MWGLLFSFAVLSAWPACSLGKPEFLTVFDGWEMYKVRTNATMTNENVQNTCRAVGLWYPCYYTGHETCSTFYRPECIKLDGSSSNSCRTLSAFSHSLCGTVDAHKCKALDDIFVYQPGYQSAHGVDYDAGEWNMFGTNHTDKYALCGGQQEYLTTWGRWAFHKVRVNGLMSSTNMRATCDLVGMSYTCYGTGVGTCTSSWSSDCIRFDHVDDTCQNTLELLSSLMCGTTDASSCQPLLNVYTIRGSYGYGVSETGYDTSGSDDNDKYALCAVRQCDISPCVHGTCSVHDQNFTCLCDSGWNGTYCDTLIDSCDSNPCLSGGTCVNEENGYSCICPPTATGNICETVLHTDKCYWISNSPLSNQDASVMCLKMEGHLAKVNDPVDQQVLISYLDDGRNISYWTSNKISPTSMCTCENGSPLSSDAPPPWVYSTANADTCVLLDAEVGYTGTYQPCTEEHNFVCQSKCDAPKY
ncbi:PREDICTED: protein jagged-1-like [Branchiostoma belcheri]|uniref:Protein jagged-1-like n=1 Tax=Branchiostoma belcheri TaxID=7741 RepID=A0A6P4XQK6_BRABE|nr:PREDICTED: protein jagged-1-like [Branchiostoma belcheri]